MITSWQVLENLESKFLDFLCFDHCSLFARSKKKKKDLSYDARNKNQIRLNTGREHIGKLQGILWQLGSRTQLSLMMKNWKLKRKTRITTI